MPERKINTLDEFIARQEKSAEKARQEGHPGRQRRLKKGIASLWSEMLDMDQPKIPSDIKKITRNRLTDGATMVLWMSPEPWPKLKPEDLKKDPLLVFMENRQCKMWSSGVGRRRKVVEYFRDIAVGRLAIKKSSTIPTEIRQITKGRITESALQAIWALPSPWLWYGDDRDCRLDIVRSPSVMYKDPDNRDLAVDYMRAVVDNLEPPLH